MIKGLQIAKLTVCSLLVYERLKFREKLGENAC
jgi:hypothetical protein